MRQSSDANADSYSQYTYFSNSTSARPIQYKAPSATVSYQSNSNSCSLYPRNSSVEQNSDFQPVGILKKNAASTPRSNQPNRYIKFLKDQNVILKDQIDQIRQGNTNDRSAQNSPTKSQPQVPTPKESPSGRSTNPTVEHIRYDQLLLKYQALEKEVNRYRSDREDKEEDKIAQIQSFLREKEQFLEEKDRLRSEILRLNSKIDEERKAAKAVAENEFADKEYQFQTTIANLKEENKQNEIEKEKCRTEINEIKTKINDIKAQCIDLQNQNEKLKNENDNLRQQIETTRPSSSFNPRQSSRVSDIQSNEINVQKRGKQQDALFEEKFNKYKKKIKELVTDSDEKNQFILKQKDDIKQLNETINTLRSQISFLESKSDQLIAEREESLSLYQRATKDAEDLRLSNITLQSEIESRDQIINDLKSKGNKTKKLKKKISQLEQQNHALTSKLKESETRISILENDPSRISVPPQSSHHPNSPKKEVPQQQNEKPHSKRVKRSDGEKPSESALELLVEKIEKLTSKFGEENKMKSEQIDKLAQQITSLSQTHVSLSKQIKELKSKVKNGGNNRNQDDSYGSFFNNSNEEDEEEEGPLNFEEEEEDDDDSVVSSLDNSSSD